LENGVFLDEEQTVRTAPASLRILREVFASEIFSDISAYEQKRLRRHENDTVTVGELTITEGRKHQVRKMLLAVGGRVIHLRRIAFGPLSLGDLPLGALRSLTEEERTALLSKAY
jgi:16S rRNA U516 pseudouridylate synthase RsuA-like enzyme